MKWKGKGSSCLDGASVRRRSRDRKVACSTTGRGTIKSTRSTQPSIRPGVGKSSTGWGYFMHGAFACVGWQVTVCDPIR